MGQLATRHLQHLVGVLQVEHGRACKGWQGEWEVGRGDPDRKLRGPAGSQMGHRSLNPGKLGTPGRGLTAKAPRERVGTQYKGTQRTRKAVHGECTVELAKWTFLIISLSREPYEAKVSRTGLTGGMGKCTVRQRALCLPSKAVHTRVKRRERTPGKRNTQKIERKHLTLRTRMKRLVRKTICFSKTTQMHDIVIGLFVNRYAFRRAG